ncbi:hypothetical protein LJC49_09880, partial [Ruminococcaceae bacterium OttesenSCG-928-I18]|nr:hypothetical protein [Ruminococcaceae bacterium OttesenSCG-928-I18]
MLKNIVITIASGLVVLLVLAFSVLVIFNYRDYFSDVVIWLVLGLIGILALFTVYMVVSRLVDAVRHKGRDVE